jgi:hypothetical protein
MVSLGVDAFVGVPSLQSFQAFSPGLFTAIDLAKEYGLQRLCRPITQ